MEDCPIPGKIARHALLESQLEFQLHTKEQEIQSIQHLDVVLIKTEFIALSGSEVPGLAGGMFLRLRQMLHSGLGSHESTLVLVGADLT